MGAEPRDVIIEFHLKSAAVCAVEKYDASDTRVPINGASDGIRDDLETCPRNRAVDRIHRSSYPFLMDCEPTRRPKAQHVQHGHADHPRQRPLRPPLPPIHNAHRQPDVQRGEGGGEGGEEDRHSSVSSARIFCCWRQSALFHWIRQSTKLNT